MILFLEYALVHGEHLTHGGQLLPVHPPLPVVGLEPRAALLVVDPIGGARLQRHRKLELREACNEFKDGSPCIQRRN